MPYDETAVQCQGCGGVRKAPEYLPEESKARLANSLENIQSAIMVLRGSIETIVRETNRVNQVADDINLLVLGSAVESVLLRETNEMETTCAADIKKFAAATMNTTYEASSSMEKVIADLAGVWKSVKQTETSLHYIRNGAQKLQDNMLQMSGAAKKESVAHPLPEKLTKN